MLKVISKIGAVGALLGICICLVVCMTAQAQATTEKPLSQNPDAVKEYNKALDVGNKGDKKAAEASYRKAIKLDPNFALAHNNLGSMLMDRGDIVGAEASYKQAIQADPKLQLARLNLGSVQVDQKKYDEAIQTLDQLIAMIGVPAAAAVPESASLGALLSGKTPADAGAVTAPLNDTQKAKAFYLLGLAHAGSGQHPAAVLDYREAAKLDATNARVHHFLAMSMNETGDQKGAIAAFQEATRLDPTLAESFFNLGALYYRSGQNKEGVAAMEAYLKLVPNSPQRKQVETAIEQMKADIKP